MKLLLTFVVGAALSTIIFSGLAINQYDSLRYEYEIRLEDAQKEIHALQHELDPTHALFTHGENSTEQEDKHSHSHETPIDLTETSWNPLVQFTATPDPVSGWNIQIQTKNFRFSPENSGGEHIEGEGHAHLYIDDIKVARLYGNWFHLASLPSGSHELRIALTSNDHHPLVKDGLKAESVVTVMAQ